MFLYAASSPHQAIEILEKYKYTLEIRFQLANGLAKYSGIKRRHVRSFVGYLGPGRTPDLTLGQNGYGLHVVGADDNIAFSLIDLLATFNVRGALA